MTKFGKYNEDGSVAQEADECILTGMWVNFDNSVRETIADTPYFYRVRNSQYNRVTDDQRAEWAKDAKKQDKPVSLPPAKAAKTSEVKE